MAEADTTDVTIVHPKVKHGAFVEEVGGDRVVEVQLDSEQEALDCYTNNLKAPAARKRSDDLTELLQEHGLDNESVEVVDLEGDPDHILSVATLEAVLDRVQQGLAPNEGLFPPSYNNPFEVIFYEDIDYGGPHFSFSRVNTCLDMAEGQISSVKMGKLVLAVVFVVFYQEPLCKGSRLCLFTDEPNLRRRYTNYEPGWNGPASCCLSPSIDCQSTWPHPKEE
jgi:hypothetical protein